MQSSQGIEWLPPTPAKFLYENFCSSIFLLQVLCYAHNFFWLLELNHLDGFLMLALPMWDIFLTTFFVYISSVKLDFSYPDASKMQFENQQGILSNSKGEGFLVIYLYYLVYSLAIRHHS